MVDCASLRTYKAHEQFQLVHDNLGRLLLMLVILLDIL